MAVQRRVQKRDNSNHIKVAVWVDVLSLGRQQSFYLQTVCTRQPAASVPMLSRHCRGLTMRTREYCECLRTSSSSSSMMWCCWPRLRLVGFPRSRPIPSSSALGLYRCTRFLLRWEHLQKSIASSNHFVGSPGYHLTIFRCGAAQRGSDLRMYVLCT